MASGLLAVSVTALVHLIVIAARATADARDVTMASVLAERKMEELRSAPFAEVSAGEFVEALDTRGELVAGEGAPGGAAFTRRWTIEPLPLDPTHAVVIAVDVSRRHASRGVVRLVTVKTRAVP